METIPLSESKRMKTSRSEVVANLLEKKPDELAAVGIGENTISLAVFELSFVFHVCYYLSPFFNTLVVEIVKRILMGSILLFASL